MATRSTRLRRPPPKEHSEQQSRARWTTTLTKILVDLMVDQVHSGNRQNNSFNKKAWKLISDNFHERAGLKWGKEQLKSRYAVLRRQHSIMRLLLEQRDFIWDETRGTITAKDEDWERFIEAYPDADTLRVNGCPVYKQLCLIFAESGANGDYNGSLVKDEIACPEPLSMVQGPSSESEKPEHSIGSHKRVRRGIDNAIADAILEMAAASKLRAAAIEQCNDRFSITDCVRALDEIQGINERIYYAALDLFDNPNARETFLSLRVDKRLAWLYSKCSSLSRT